MNDKPMRRVFIKQLASNKPSPTAYYKRGQAPVLLSPAEDELIGLLRGEEDQEFSVTIARRGGHTFVVLHESPQESRASEGDGETFDAAWQAIRPWWFD
jgi:hypothetical protein